MKTRFLLTVLSLWLSTLGAFAYTNTLGAPVLQGTNLFSGQNLLTNSANVFAGDGSGLTGLTGLTNLSAYALATNGTLRQPTLLWNTNGFASSLLCLATGLQIGGNVINNYHLYGTNNSQVMKASWFSFIGPASFNSAPTNSASGFNLADLGDLANATNNIRTNTFYGNGAGLTNVPFGVSTNRTAVNVIATNLNFITTGTNTLVTVTNVNGTVEVGIHSTASGGGGSGVTTNAVFWTNGTAKSVGVAVNGGLIVSNAYGQVITAPDNALLGSNAMTAWVSNSVVVASIGTNGNASFTSISNQGVMWSSGLSVDQAATFKSGLYVGASSPGIVLGAYGMSLASAGSAIGPGPISYSFGVSTARPTNQWYALMNNNANQDATNVMLHFRSQSESGLADASMSLLSANYGKCRLGVATNLPQEMLHVNGNGRLEGYLCFGATNVVPPSPTATTSNLVYIYSSTSGGTSNYGILKAVNGHKDAVTLSPHPLNGPSELYDVGAVQPQHVVHNEFGADGSHEWINLTRMAKQLEEIKTQLGMKLPPVIMTETADDFYKRTGGETPEVQSQIDAAQVEADSADMLGVEYTPSEFVQKRLDQQQSLLMKPSGVKLQLNP